jgi:hypothetical protein
MGRARVLTFNQGTTLLGDGEGLPQWREWPSGCRRMGGASQVRGGASDLVALRRHDRPGNQPELAESRAACEGPRERPRMREERLKGCACGRISEGGKQHSLVAWVTRLANGAEIEVKR